MNRAELPRVLDAPASRRLGVTKAKLRTELRRGSWRQLARGIVLTRPDPPIRTDWAVVGLLLTGNHGLLSGWDALRYYGLARGEPPCTQVLVLCTRGGGRDVGLAHIRRVAGPVATRLTSVLDPDLPLVALASPARAVADTAPMYRRDSVRALVASAVQKQVCTPEDLAVSLRQAARRGSAQLRRALADVLDGARSAAEAEALAQLRTAPVPSFELNVPILDADGRLQGVADVLWRELRAVLEVDSREYHFSEADWKRTTEQHNRLTTQGLTLTHYPPSRITGDVRWVGEVVDWLTWRARELGVAYFVDPRPLSGGPPLRLR